ncbi:MAG: nucleotidyltransferase domain-containing protein [Rothia sp. (in: high G+C Gram-positive bacteria)]|nr:nucleotidyltransferase domain-containing protein [Rothia sp. (in: high G+C Gram-positive bacteria)]
MPRSYDLPHEHEVVEILRAYGVQRAQIFGSAARGELKDSSDIDLLVEFKPGILPTLGFRFFDLKQELESTVHRKVDLLTSVKEPFLPYIQQDLQDIPL